MVERAKQLPLPAVPYTWPDSANVGNREQQEEFQALRRLHQRREVEHRLEVVEIAGLSGLAHDEVIADEPSCGIGFGWGQPEPRPESAGDLLAGPRMSLAVALGDIVKEGGNVERTPVLEAGKDAGRERMVVPELPPIDRREHSNGPDQMLIDRIMVIHVELHHRDDAAEIGNEAAENACLIHPPQRRFRVAA